jgi:hypothetical protein
VSHQVIQIILLWKQGVIVSLKLGEQLVDHVYLVLGLALFAFFLL